MKIALPRRGISGRAVDRPALDPVPLPEGAVACGCCGCAVPAGQGGDTYMMHAGVLGRSYILPGLGGQGSHAQIVSGARVRLGRCGSCAETAQAMVETARAHPGVDRGRLVDASWALASTGVRLPAPGAIGTDDLAMLAESLSVLGSSVRWDASFCVSEVGAANVAAELADGCAPSPWACVPVRTRAEIAARWGLILSWRVGRGRGPVGVAPPEGRGTGRSGSRAWVGGGCLLCGVAEVVVDGAEVVRAGGVDRAAGRVWSSVSWCPSVLGVGYGTRGVSVVAGHLCPVCARAVEAEGYGWHDQVFWVRVLLRYLGLGRDEMGDTTFTGLPWGGLVFDRVIYYGREAPAPNRAPWGHLGTADELVAAARSPVPGSPAAEAAAERERLKRELLSELAAGSSGGGMSS